MTSCLDCLLWGDGGGSSGLCCHLSPYWCLWPLLLLRAVMVSMVLDATKGHINVFGLYCYQRPFWGPWLILEAMWTPVIHTATRNQVEVHDPCCTDCRGARELLWQRYWWLQTHRRERETEWIILTAVLMVPPTSVHLIGGCPLDFL